MENNPEVNSGSTFYFPYPPLSQYFIHYRTLFEKPRFSWQRGGVFWREVKPFERKLLQFFSKMGRLPDSEWKDSFKQLQEDLFGKHGLLEGEEIGYIGYKN